MKQSIFNRVVRIDDNRRAVYNTLTGFLAIFEDEEYKKIFIDDINDLPIEEQKTIKKTFLFVDDDIDELSLVLLKRNKAILHTEIPTFRILVTTACNAKCPYCFEDGVAPLMMTREVAQKIVEFILEKAVHSKRIKVQWFGGEPLLDIETIEFITRELNSKCMCEISYSMITNGSLLSSNTASKLKSLGVERIQITLDGDKKIYEERKRYVNISNGFEMVLNNIINALKEDISISVRINYDGETINSVRNLIGILKTRFHKYGKFSCYPYPIYGTYNDRSSKGTTATDLLTLHRDIVSSGLVSEDVLFEKILKVKTGPCMACNSDSFFIAPDGKLYKCSLDLKNNVGDVFGGIKYNTHYFNWCNLILRDECKKCNLLPICQGGCRAGVLGLTSISCMRDKEIIDDIIRIRYANAIK